MLIAVERRGSGMGRVRFARIPDTSADSLLPAIEDLIEPGSIVATDGHAAYNGIAGAGYTHDRHSLGGFNWSSQHLVMGVVRGGCWQASAGDSSDARSDVVAGPAVGGPTGGSSAVLASDCGWLLERAGGCGGGRLAGGWQPVVSRRWRDAADLVGPAVGAVPLVC